MKDQQPAAITARARKVRVIIRTGTLVVEVVTSITRAVTSPNPSLSRTRMIMIMRSQTRTATEKRTTKQ